jgi:germination protein M
VTVARLLLVIALLLAGAVLTGCGGSEAAEPATTDRATESEPAEETDVSVYFLLDGKVWPVRRTIESTPAVASAALEALIEGPTEEESEELSLGTAVPEGTEVVSITVQDGVAQVAFSTPLPNEAIAQAVYTLTQFPTVDSVEIVEGGVAIPGFERGDYEDLTPAILVESPRFFEEVGNPVRATGSANTFEATLQYELTDTDGRIVDEGFVTATSGSGERGTFDFTTDEYEIPFDGVGALVVFELSAKDGSRINLVEIPIRMSR